MRQAGAMATTDPELSRAAIVCGVLLVAAVAAFVTLAWWEDWRGRREETAYQAGDAGLGIIAPRPKCPCCGGRHCAGGGPSTMEQQLRERIEARRRAALRETTQERFHAIIRRSYDTQELDRVRAMWSEAPVYDTRGGAA